MCHANDLLGAKMSKSVGGQPLIPIKGFLLMHTEFPLAQSGGVSHQELGMK